jgi:hypothetical protein
MPRDADARRTIILFATVPSGRSPQEGDQIYFEVDRRLTEVNVIDTEVHLHLFHAMPGTPAEALAQSGTSDAALTGKVDFIDVAAGSAEIDTDWYIDNPIAPELKPAGRPFRPPRAQGKQQVRAHVIGSVAARFDYLFDSGKGQWVPELGQEQLYDEETKLKWLPVTGFREPVAHHASEQPLLMDLRETSPASGSFILFSRRRRRVGAR